ncbi:hypothetical protein HN873_039372 [Arachis hypogaea]
MIGSSLAVVWKLVGRLLCSSALLLSLCRRCVRALSFALQQRPSSSQPNCQLSVKQVNPRQYIAEIPQELRVSDGVGVKSLMQLVFSHQMVFLAQVSNLQCSLCLVLSPTRELAQQICVSSIFLEGEDINMSISHAADSIGLKEIPRYEVKIIEEDDWMKGAQALEPATLVPLQLLKSSGTKCIMKKIKITLHKLIMALPYSFATTTKSSVFSKLHDTSFFQHNQLQGANVVTVVKCESKDSSEDNIELQAKGPKLEIGSPIIFTEASKMIKTVASVPCLRVNSGLVKPGDVGSQYLTALLMAAPLALSDVEIEIIDKMISIPYVDMTLKLMERFRVHVEHSGNWDRFLVHGGQKYKSPGNAFVEGDASSASYFLAGAAVTGGTITVVGCGTSSLQNHPAGLNLLSPGDVKINFQCGA